MKSLYDISWAVSETQYRNDSALSYSIIAKYSREGFNNLNHLFDKVESPSLLFGSVVDTLLTGTEKEFNERFYVGTFPDIKDSERKLVDALWNSREWPSGIGLKHIDDTYIIEYSNLTQFQLNWKPETRAKVIKEHCSGYWKCLQESKGKEVIDQKLYEDAQRCVSMIKERFSNIISTTPFENKEVLYQLKFKGEYDGVPLRIMADIIAVDHDNKVIYPYDLKTTFHKEWDFPESFVTWRYMYQASLYWYIIRQNLDKDEYFKDFKLDNYRFLVINRESCIPLIWKFNGTTNECEYIFGKTYIPGWRTTVKELYSYLQHPVKVPEGISLEGDNIIEDYFKDE